ncbi:MAG: hypothetical protein COX30_00725 [Candidatus Moranbacteria bacterium CG23_combo_of_CG06-09_8_20_14_all_39_10]|nr:MAG: hypothetical protein COX30_00725 [Candidatus Moranbacteria bacterium CG23_combo_of_CG06-09_8_20_14_all_39_10]
MITCHSAASKGRKRGLVNLATETLDCKKRKLRFSPKHFLSKKYFGGKNNLKQKCSDEQGGVGMKNTSFEIFSSGVENKVDVVFSDGRVWGVYYDPSEKYEWIECICERCGKKKGGYDRDISIKIMEIIDSNKMTPVKRHPSILKIDIESFLTRDDEFVCSECFEKET